MTDDGATSEPPVRLRTNRFEAFSDGVFAIAITILVLEISVPAGSEDDLLKAILDQWPSYVAYLVSFATIGAIWLGHATITEYLDRTDALLVRLNLLLLMFVSFIPFPTKLLAENSGRDNPARVAAIFYGIMLLVTASLLSLVWRYALRERLVRPDAGDQEVKTLTKRVTPTLAAYVVMIALSLLVPTVAVAGYFVIAVFLLFPFGLRARRHRERLR
jgi:uncharacterized membrane protein